MSSDDEYGYSDPESLDGLENEDSDFQSAPSKGPTTKVLPFQIFEFGIVFDAFGARNCFVYFVFVFWV